MRDEQPSGCGGRTALKRLFFALIASQPSLRRLVPRLSHSKNIEKSMHFPVSVVRLLGKFGDPADPCRVHLRQHADADLRQAPPPECPTLPSRVQDELANLISRPKYFWLPKLKSPSSQWHKFLTNLARVHLLQNIYRIMHNGR